MERFFVRLKYKEPRDITRSEVYFVDAETMGDAVSIVMEDLNSSQKEYCYESFAQPVRTSMRGKTLIYSYDNFGLHDPLGNN